MALRELVAFLGYKVDKKSEGQVKNSLAGLKKLAVGLGAAFGAGAIIKGLKNTVEEVRTLADEMDKTSQQIGLSAQSLEELRHAANLAGVGANEMSNSLGKLQKNAFEAATGNKTMAEDFALLGINVRDTNGDIKTADVLFNEFADGIAGLDNETTKVALSMNLMGRSGKKLLPLLNQGSEALEAQRQEARDLGGIFGQDLIKASVDLTDNMARFDFFMRGIKATIATELIPIIDSFIRKLTKTGAAFREDVQKGAKAVAWAFGLLAEAIAIISRDLPIVVAVFGTLLAIMFPMIGVLAAIAAGVVLLLQQYQLFGTEANTYTNALVGEFKLLQKETGSVFGAIGGMLKTAVEFWTKLLLENTAFGDYFDKSIEGMRNWVKDLKNLVNDAISFVTKPAELLASFIGDRRLAALERGDFAGALSGGGGVATGGVARQLASNSVVNRPNTTANITIEGGPTANNVDLARRTAREIKNVQQDQNRNSFKELVP